MEEESGSAQVKHGSPTFAQTSPTSGLRNEGCPADCLKNAPSICMPICFLVREQAKSQIALQDLQKRIHNLEGVQDEVISAISEVHDYLSGSGERQDNLLQFSNSPKSESSVLAASGPQAVQNLDVPKADTSLSPLKTRRSSSRTNLASSLSFADAWKNALKKTDAECSMPAQSGHHQKFLDGARVKDSAAPESDKQDSGLESDCRDQGQESNPPHNAAENSLEKVSHSGDGGDELMNLLDEIGEKSQMLRQNLSVREANCEPSQNVSMEMSRLHMERLGLQNLLSNIKGERDVLRSRVDDLETTTDELATEKKDLEQRFVTTLVEKHKLEARLQGFDTASASGKAHNMSNNYSGSGDSRSSAYRLGSSGSSRKMGCCKVNSADVSAVLKETNAVDLQKQVLTYMMENKVLHTKLEQVEQMLTLKDVEKECLEKVHREEMRQVVCENEQLQLAFEEQKMEATSLKAKVRMLERVLQSVTVENRELNVLLGESMYLKEALQRGRIPVQRPSTSSQPTRYSLPAQHAGEEEVTVRCTPSKLLPNTSSYLDVTVEDPDASDNDLAFTIGPFGFSQRKSSTPLVPSNRLEKPTFLDFAKPSPVVDPGSSSRLDPAAFRKSGKRLTFNSVKPLAHSTHLGLSAADLARSRNFRAAAESCDKAARADNSVIRHPDLSRDNPSDPKKFPFYTILEKLKASSDYKLPGRNSVREEDEEAEVRVGDGLAATRGKIVNKNGSSPQAANCAKSSPDRKCNNSANSEEEESNQAQKDKRSSSKSIHRRIQNILDRITAESDEAVV